MRYLLFVSKSYSYEILRPLQAAIRARGDHQNQVAWFLHAMPVGSLRADERVLHTVQEVRQFNPTAVFAPGNWVPDFFPGVKVEVFHGFGIEKRGHFRVRGFFDLYCTHGPATTLPFQQLATRLGYFQVAQTGWPKMDPLFRHGERPGEITDYRAQHAITTPLVLFAPTFSPALTSAPHLADAIAQSARSGRLHWLVKFHPNMAHEWIAKYRTLAGPGLTVLEDEPLLPLLHAADVMVSDTSSVVAEFLSLEKPVVTFRAQQPGAHVLNISDATQLDSAVLHALQRPPEVMQAAREFIAQMHPYQDGLSSERVLAATDEFVVHHAGRLKAKPMNLWRRLQVRRRMRYWKF